MTANMYDHTPAHYNDILVMKPDFHECDIEQLAFELAGELEVAEMDSNDYVTVNREKLLAISKRVYDRYNFFKNGYCETLLRERDALKAENAELLEWIYKFIMAENSIEFINIQEEYIQKYEAKQ